MRRFALTTTLFALGLLGMGTGTASALPATWNFDLHHAPTHFAAGEEGVIWPELQNVGAEQIDGPITVDVDLPSGLTRANNAVQTSATGPNWDCPGSAGDTFFNCTLLPTPSQFVGDGNLPRYFGLAELELFVDVHPALPGGEVIVDAEVSGANAGTAQASETITVHPDPAGFGIIGDTWTPGFFDLDGLTSVDRAGSHPPRLITPFDLNMVVHPRPNFGANRKFDNSEHLRSVSVDLPPGFLGAPAAVGECDQATFTIGACPLSSVVGRFDFTGRGTGSSVGSSWRTLYMNRVFNLVNPTGVLTDLAFVIAGNPVHVKASLDPANGYAVTTDVPQINETLPVTSQRLTIWGVPGDPAYDAQRCPEFAPNVAGGGESTAFECPSDAPKKPFLTLPSRCGEPDSLRLHSYDSWEDPGDFGPPLSGDVGPFTDCEEIPFEPTVSLTPTTDAADSASGLDVRIELPQHDECEPIEPAPPAGDLQYECGVNGRATSPLRDATVTLPEGLAVNAASANGLAACAPAQIGLGTDDPANCPNGSKVASVEVITPALPDPVEGVVYLATPHDNPFNSLLAGYIVLAQPERGLLVKIPGKIEADPDTGQITGIFNDNPQLPFSEFELHFKGGAHSTLVTPATCGDYTAEAQFSAWAGKAVQESSDFAITQAAGGGDCPTDESDLPHDPDLDAGSVSPIAGQHSPFVVNLRREDGSQRFSEVTVKPPPGLTAKLAGTPYCPDSALAAAENRDGKAEQSSPSCPSASKIGNVYAQAGAGPDPYNAPGTAYLSGPYKGAPLSMAIVTPAVAGPFDLGTVVIRTALHVNPVTAEITAVSDAIPQMLEGIPLNVRSASIRLDKPDFTLNPTSCNEKQISGELLSTLGIAANLSERFQLGECRRLGFKPRLFLRLFGKRFNRSSNPRLRAVLVPRQGDANIAFASVKMPASIFLDQDHIRTVCTRAQFATDTCPARAIYGSAAATTPLLEEPLRGPVYLRSSDNLLPDLVSDLRGQVRVEAVGRTDSVKGALRNTFDIVPDAPVTKFVLNLQAGNKSLLVASRNLCAGVQRALILMRAHNGRASLVRQRINIPRCRAIRKAAKRKAMRRKRARNRGARRSARRASVSAQRAVR